MIEEMTVGPGLEHRLALLGKVRQGAVARLGSDLGTPGLEKVPHFPLGGGVATGRRIGDPEVDLEAAVGAGPDFARPGLDRFRPHQQRPATPYAPRHWRRRSKARADRRRPSARAGSGCADGWLGRSLQRESRRGWAATFSPFLLQVGPAGNGSPARSIGIRKRSNSIRETICPRGLQPSISIEIRITW